MKLKLLFSVLLLQFAFVSCSNNSDDEPVGTIELTVNEIYRNSVKVSVTATNPNTLYYCTSIVMTDATLSDAELVVHATEEIQMQAAASSMGVGEYVASKARKGNTTFTVEGLADMTSHTVFAIGVDANGAALSGVITSAEARTPDLFTFSIDKHSSSLWGTIEPLESGMTYYTGITTANFVESMGLASADEFRDEILREFREMAEAQSVSLESILSPMLSSGTYDYKHTDLVPQTQYYIYAFGVTPAGEYTSGLVLSEMTPTNRWVSQSSAYYNVRILTITNTDFTVQVIPPDDQVRYCISAIKTDEYDAKYEDGHDYARAIIAEGNKLNVDWATDNTFTYSGTVTLSVAEDLGGSVQKGDDYLVFVFEVSDQGEHATFPTAAQVII